MFALALRPGSARLLRRSPAGAAPPRTPITSRYVPDDAVALLVISPAELLANPVLEMVPVEILRARQWTRWESIPLTLRWSRSSSGYQPRKARSTAL